MAALKPEPRDLGEEMCGICGETKFHSASHNCAQCTLLLCEECVIKHNNNPVFRQHYVSQLSVQKTLLSPCTQHPNTALTHLCNTCVPKRILCPICIIEQHTIGHDVVPLADTAKDVRKNLIAGRNKIASKADELRAYLRKVKRMTALHNATLDNVQEEIRNHSQMLVGLVLKKEKKMLEAANSKVQQLIASYKERTFSVELKTMESVEEDIQTAIKGTDKECIDSEQTLEEQIKQTMTVIVPLQEPPKDDACIKFVPRKLKFDIGSLITSDEVSHMEEVTPNKKRKVAKEKGETTPTAPTLSKQKSKLKSPKTTLQYKCPSFPSHKQVNTQMNRSPQASATNVETDEGRNAMLDMQATLPDSSDEDIDLFSFFPSKIPRQPTGKGNFKTEGKIAGSRKDLTTKRKHNDEKGHKPSTSTKEKKGEKRMSTSVKAASLTGLDGIPPPMKSPEQLPVTDFTARYVFFDLKTDHGNITQLAATSSTGIFERFISIDVPEWTTIQDFIAFLGNSAVILCGINTDTCALLLQAAEDHGLAAELENVLAGILNIPALLKNKHQDETKENKLSRSIMDKQVSDEALKTAQTLERHILHLCPDRQERLAFTICTNCFKDILKYNKTRLENMATWKPLLEESIISRHIAEKAAASGLKLEHLQRVFKAKGVEGLSILLSKEGLDGKPRVTKMQKIIIDIASHISIHEKISRSSAKVSDDLWKIISHF